MRPAARLDPAAQRMKVRDLAKGAIGAAGDIAADMVEGYRKSTRYFKMRAAVIGSWALLSVVTLWAACPAQGPANALGAKFQLLPSSDPGVLTGTQVLVENDSSRIWRDVVFTLDGGWQYEKKTVRPQDKVVIAVAQFRKDGGTAPPDLEPRAITVECSEGRITASLEAAR